mmetsp:Transcript_9664/g.12693  ORF Transcript_9664/g.12693 Transcript_9664/m.12693 type:complete len:213 (+) Transcript_9664:1920-2558(+)
MESEARAGWSEEARRAGALFCRTAILWGGRAIVVGRPQGRQELLRWHHQVQLCHVFIRGILPRLFQYCFGYQFASNCSPERILGLCRGGVVGILFTVLDLGCSGTFGFWFGGFSFGRDFEIVFKEPTDPEAGRYLSNLFLFCCSPWLGFGCHIEFQGCWRHERGFGGGSRGDSRFCGLRIIALWDFVCPFGFSTGSNFLPVLGFDGGEGRRR